MLQDLVPDDIYEDDEGAFDAFVARLKPLLGDLLVVSGGQARRRPVRQDDEAEDTPLLDLVLGNWLPRGEPDTLESRVHIVLKHSVCDTTA